MIYTVEIPHAVETAKPEELTIGQICAMGAMVLDVRQAKNAAFAEAMFGSPSETDGALDRYSIRESILGGAERALNEALREVLGDQAWKFEGEVSNGRAVRIFYALGSAEVEEVQRGK